MKMIITFFRPFRNSGLDEAVIAVIVESSLDVFLPVHCTVMVVVVVCPNHATSS